MKTISKITKQSKPSVTSMGKSNMVPVHGHGSTKGGGDNYKKTSNTIGVQKKG